MLFLTHNTVNVYRVEKEDGSGILRQFSYSTEAGVWEFDKSVFDVRNLSTWQGSGAVVLGGYPISTEFPEIERAIRQAIDEGLIA